MCPRRKRLSGPLQSLSPGHSRSPCPCSLSLSVFVSVIVSVIGSRFGKPNAGLSPLPPESRLAPPESQGRRYVCLLRGRRDNFVCCCLYIDETMRGHSIRPGRDIRCVLPDGDAAIALSPDRSCGSWLLHEGLTRRYTLLGYPTRATPHTHRRAPLRFERK
jgi:hypothetical protein